MPDFLINMAERARLGQFAELREFVARTRAVDHADTGDWCCVAGDFNANIPHLVASDSEENSGQVVRVPGSSMQAVSDEMEKKLGLEDAAASVGMEWPCTFGYIPAERLLTNPEHKEGEQSTLTERKSERQRQRQRCALESPRTMMMPLFSLVSLVSHLSRFTRLSSFSSFSSFSSLPLSLPLSLPFSLPLSLPVTEDLIFIDPTTCQARGLTSVSCKLGDAAEGGKRGFTHITDHLGLGVELVPRVE